MEAVVTEAKEERVTIIKVGADKAVNKDGGGVGAEGGVERIYVA